MDWFWHIASGMGTLRAGISPNLVYDYLIRRFLGKKQITASELEHALHGFLQICDLDVSARTIVQLLAEQGYIDVTPPEPPPPVPSPAETWPVEDVCFLGSRTLH